MIYCDSKYFVTVSVGEKYAVKKYIYLFIQSNYTLKLWLFIAWITIGSLMALFLLFWFGLDDFVVWTQLIWIFAVNLRSHSYRRIRRYMNIQMNINFTMEFILPIILDGVIHKIIVCTLCLCLYEKSILNANTFC